MLSSAQEPTPSPNAGGLSDEDLVARILAGESTYFAVLYGRYKQGIQNFSVYATDYETGQDLSQQTFIKALENIRALKKGECFKSWLYRIAHNIIQDHRRRLRLRHWVPWAEVTDEQVRDGLCIGASEQEWEQHVEDTLFVRQTMQKVSPKYRSCTYLAVFEAWKAPEIARALHIPERTVRRYIGEGEAELRLAYRYLAQEPSDSPEEEKK